MLGRHVTFAWHEDRVAFLGGLKCEHQHVLMDSLGHPGKLSLFTFAISQSCLHHRPANIQSRHTLHSHIQQFYACRSILKGCYLELCSYAKGCCCVQVFIDWMA